MPLERQEVHGFLGVNLRKDRTSLADEEMARAINGDLHAQTGTLVVRLPRSPLFSPALADLVIRRLARVNNARYQVAGVSLYRDQVKIIDGLLSPNLVTTITPFRPLLDTTIWALIADDAIMRKASTTVVRNWGLVAPTIAPTVGVAPQAGVLTGDYHVVYTFIRFDGTAVAAESNPSPTSATVTLSAGSISITVNTTALDPQVNGIGIYRTVADGTLHLLDSRLPYPTTSAYGGTFQWEAAGAAAAGNGLVFVNTFEIEFDFVATQTWEDTADTTGENVSEDPLGRHGTYLWEIALGYVTTQTVRWNFASILPDNSLGAEVERDNDPPPLASWATEFQGHVFLTRDAANPDRLWWSKRFRPESVPVDNFLTIGTPDDPLQCAVSLSGLLAVLTRKTKYRVSGSSTSGFNAQEALTSRGTIAPMAALATEFGLVFAAQDGVFRTNVISEDEELSKDIEPLFFGEEVNGFQPINFDAAMTIAAAYHKGRYFLSLPTGTNTTPDLLAVYSRMTQKWYFFDHPARSLYSERDTNLLLAGFTDGLVYVLEDGTSTTGDGGQNITIDWQTKDYFGGSLSIRKLFQWAKVDVDTLGEPVTAELYIDGVLKRTTTITGTRTKNLIAYPGGTIGYTWRIRLIYSGKKRIRWSGSEAVWAPLEAA
jgi:hypothetical protein